MSEIVIQIEHVTKEYRLGTISHGMLYRDLQSWWARVRGEEDPNSVIGSQRPERVESKDRFLALSDINMEVKQGETVGIIGRNGAGKSTLLKILSRVTAPTSGVVKLNGRIASLLEVGTGFHPELTGRENIYLNGAILGMNKEEIGRKFDEIVDFSGVEKFIDTPVKRYSSGMYVRLAFSVAAHLEPEILIVDEVLAVGDVEFQKKCLGKMQNVAGQGRTVLFVSHNMSAVRTLCSRAILLEQGGLVEDGSSDHVIASYLDRDLLDGTIASEKELAERMEGVIEKGVPYIRFQEIALLDKEGHLRKIFHSDEDITVSIGFRCLRPIQNLNMIVEVVDENNMPILCTQNIDDPLVSERFLRIDRGLYRATCLLPKNTFGAKSLFLTVHLIYPKTEHLIVNKILEFQVKFSGYNNHFGGANVFIRPLLRWSMNTSSDITTACEISMN